MNDDDDYKLLKMREVCALTSLSRATINRKIAEGEFPRGVKLGQGRTGYRRKLVIEWIRSRF
jgi:prophage regulatory protein